MQVFGSISSTRCPPARRHHCPAGMPTRGCAPAPGRDHRVVTDRTDARGERGDSLSFAAVTPPAGVHQPPFRSILCRIWKHGGKRRLARIEASGTSHWTIVGVLPTFRSKLSRFRRPCDQGLRSRKMTRLWLSIIPITKVTISIQKGLNKGQGIKGRSALYLGSEVRVC